MTRSMCDNNVYAGVRFPSVNIADIMLNRGPAGDTIVLTDADYEENKRYALCMDMFQKYPMVLQNIMKNSDGSIFKLREHIYNIFETRVNVRDLRAMHNSENELKKLIAEKYAKKSSYKTQLDRSK